MKKRYYLVAAVMCLCTFLTLSSCKKTVYPIVSTGTPNITDYFIANPTQFSLFEQILDRTSYSGFLGAYGGYTVFAPNNAAVTAYLTSLGKTAVSQVDIPTLQAMVKFHVIQDTLSTSNFTDGKLPTPTLYGQYLTTGAANINGTSYYTVNKQANILQTNIRLGNGNVFVIDHVLTPATLTVAQFIAASPKYTIFTQALKATGYYDTLNVVAATNPNTTRNYFTVFAEPDSVFIANGIPNYAALLAKYSFTGQPLNNPTDSLNLFVGYHILAENSYLNDIISKPSHSTLAPGNIISDVLQGQTILLNNDTFNGIVTPGLPIDRANSDVTTTSGVVHSVLGHLHITVYAPARVDFDLGDQPEFRAQTTIFRRAGQSTIFYVPGTLSNIYINGGYVQYFMNASTTTNFYWWDDQFNMGDTHAGFRSSPAGLWNDIVFTTPVVIKGKYKVWFMWRNSSETSGGQFFVDGVALQNVIVTWANDGQNGTDSDPVMESKGLKRYSQAPTTNTTQCSELCGVVNILTTDHHKFEIVAINGGNNASITADMMQFIPIDQDQEYPRFARNGTLIPRP
jgi:uncharacterized surface protein with fasciclin (FAS1) repeats